TGRLLVAKVHEKVLAGRARPNSDSFAMGWNSGRKGSEDKNCTTMACRRARSTELRDLYDAGRCRLDPSHHRAEHRGSAGSGAGRFVSGAPDRRESTSAGVSLEHESRPWSRQLLD